MSFGCDPRQSKLPTQVMTADGTVLPNSLPLGLVRKLGSSCQWWARGIDLPQWKGDRSAIGQSTGKDDPHRKSRC
jgi:hypothetical protein